MTKLDPKTRDALFREYATTRVTQVTLAQKYGVTQAHISYLLRRDDLCPVELRRDLEIARGWVRGRRGRKPRNAAVVGEAPAAVVGDTDAAGVSDTAGGAGAVALEDAA